MADWSLVFLTAALVVGTLLYAWYTGKLVKETRSQGKSMVELTNALNQASKASVRPSMRLALAFFGPMGVLMEIKNVGPGAAVDVKARYWVQEYQEKSESTWHTPLVSSGASQRIIIKGNDGSHQYTFAYFKSTQTTLKVTFDYKDMYGEPYHDEETIDLTAFVSQSSLSDGTVAYQESDLRKIDRTLDQIKNKLGGR